MKAKILCLGLSLIFSLELLAQKPKFDIQKFYPIESSHSYLGFSIKYMGYAMVRGRFANFDGTVFYDPNDVAKTSVTLSVDVASIDTDVDFRDRDLKSDNWFDAEKFPKMIFQSKETIPNENGMMVNGMLTIKDVSKEVSIQMEPASGVLNDMRGDHQVIFTGKLTIDRTDYHVEGENWSKVKEGITGVEKEVNIEISILAKQIQESNFMNWVRNPETPQGKIFATIEESGVKKGLEEFEELRKQDSENINPRALLFVGRMLLKQGKVEESIMVHEKNLEVFPDNAFITEALAEAWGYKDPKKAKLYYTKVLELVPGNSNAIEILRHLD